MSTTQTLILGAIAGFTIFLGLPLGRVRSTSPRCRAALTRARDRDPALPVLGRARRTASSRSRRALEAHDWAAFAGYAALLAGGFAAGLMSLVYYDGWLKHQARRRRSSARAPRRSTSSSARVWLEALTPGRRLALLIATGIGLHNFAEGLAIGQSAAAGELALALVLIIGFGLHNATEGFGIVGPMSAEAERPSWALPRRCSA